MRLTRICLLVLLPACVSCLTPILHQRAKTHNAERGIEPIEAIGLAEIQGKWFAIVETEQGDNGTFWNWKPERTRRCFPVPDRVTEDFLQLDIADSRLCPDAIPSTAFSSWDAKTGYLVIGDKFVFEIGQYFRNTYCACKDFPEKPIKSILVYADHAIMLFADGSGYSILQAIDDKDRPRRFLTDKEVKDFLDAPICTYQGFGCPHRDGPDDREYQPPARNIYRATSYRPATLGGIVEIHMRDSSEDRVDRAHDLGRVFKSTSAQNNQGTTKPFQSSIVILQINGNKQRYVTSHRAAYLLLPITLPLDLVVGIVAAPFFAYATARCLWEGPPGGH